MQCNKDSHILSNPVSNITILQYDRISDNMTLTAAGHEMNPATYDSEIAEATKRYVEREWRLDVSSFGRTRNRAWVRLAGRILDQPGATMPVKSLQVRLDI
jgi:hypothetical protein